VITAPLLRAIVDGYPLPLDGVHGLSHWARVLENGRRLAAVTGADVRVVELFAVFHDARRANESIDPGHGRRGADLARRWRGTLVELDQAAFQLLVTACETHTRGLTDGDITVRTCWDADRLDLLRCRIEPDPAQLATEAARDPSLLEWANRRATARHEPAVLVEQWRPWLQDREKGRRRVG
jgi:uncharacterized protein